MWAKQGFIKINCVVVWEEITKMSGIRVVRDDAGYLVGVHNPQGRNHVAKTLDVSALTHGLQLGMDRGWNPIILESDSEVVINQIIEQSLKKKKWRLASLVDNI